MRLGVLNSQQHSVVRPLLRFIGTLDRQADTRVLIVIPEVVPERQASKRTDGVIGTAPMHVPSLR